MEQVPHVQSLFTMCSWIALSIMIASELLLGFHLITVVAGNNEPVEIIIKGDCQPNTEIGDLDTLLKISSRQSNINYILSGTPNVVSFFKSKNSKLFANSKISMGNMCSEIQECCDKSMDFCILNITIYVTGHRNTDKSIRLLRIRIIDVNDHQPQFKNKTFSIALMESKRDPHIVYLEQAKDDDFGRNRIQDYSIGSRSPSSFDRYFSLVVKKDLGVPSDVGLRLKKELDREAIDQFTFELLAIDGDPSMKRTGTATIVIRITDENDNVPIFTSSTFKTKIKEGSYSSIAIMELSATDRDDGENGRVIYSIRTNDALIDEYFDLRSDGKIFLKKPLDYEQKTVFKFSVMATNPTSFTNSAWNPASAEVEIEVENIDDEPLGVVIDYYEGKNLSKVIENSEKTVIGLVTVNSAESSRKNPAISCRVLKHQKLLELIDIPGDDSTAKLFEISTTGPIDREVHSRLDTAIRCRDSNYPNVKESEASLVVVIMDINDNDPALRVEGRRVIRENGVNGKVVLTVTATDPDAYENGTVFFSLSKSPSPSLEYLEIGEKDGKIRVIKAIDCESFDNPLKKLVIIVTASDHGNPMRSADLRIVMVVEDSNDNAPTFASVPLVFDIDENQPNGTTVGEIEVNDRDHSDNITLVIVGKSHKVPFIIAKPNRDRVFLLISTRPIDYEVDQRFQVKLVAYDGYGASSHSVTEIAKVNVINANDNKPIIIFPTQNSSNLYRISCFEPIDYKLLLVSAADLDKSDDNRLEYRIEDESSIFSITNEEKYIITQREMSKSDVGSKIILLVVSDVGSPRFETSVPINIVIDESPPKSSQSRIYRSKTSNEAEENAQYTNDYLLYILLPLTFIIPVSILIISACLYRYNGESKCSNNSTNLCCKYRRPSTDVSTPMDSVPNLRFTLQGDKPEYHTHQVLENNNCKAIDYINHGEQWEHDKFKAFACDSPTGSLIRVVAYTGYENQRTLGVDQMCHPNLYQTIGNTHPGQRERNMTSRRMSTYQALKGELYNSEWNINRRDNDYHDFFSRDILAFQTPLPTRSRYIDCNTLSQESIDQFATAYPKDESTFV